MANVTSYAPLRGPCPAPFFDASQFGSDVEGRFRALLPRPSNLSCFLPCPATDYLYPQDFGKWYRAAEALNVAGSVCMTFFLVSYVALPAEHTRRHYLNSCSIVAAMFLTLGFVVPLGAKPEQCFDEITPNDMHTNLACACSGTFVVAGAVSMAVWTFVRALSIHLRVFWDAEPEGQFHHWAQALGWAVAAGISIVTMVVTGVSFRFGDVCHVNAAHSLATFWGPLLAIAGAAAFLQILTFAYCTKVFLQSIGSDNTRSQRAIYRRVREVVFLLWREAVTVALVLVDMVFFSHVFMRLDSMSTSAADGSRLTLPFWLCLAENSVEPGMCTELVEGFSVHRTVVRAVLLVLSSIGLPLSFLLARTSIFKAWADLFKHLVKYRGGKDSEFVSLGTYGMEDSRER